MTGLALYLTLCRETIAFDVRIDNDDKSHGQTRNYAPNYAARLRPNIHVNTHPHAPSRTLSTLMLAFAEQPTEPNPLTRLRLTFILDWDSQVFRHSTIQISQISSDLKTQEAHYWHPSSGSSKKRYRFRIKIKN